jgi:hypothetical protein
MDYWSDPALGTYTTLDAMGSALDADGDGLTNEQEALNLTDPYKPDTDQDGLSDGFEVNVVMPEMAANNRAILPTTWDSDADFISDYDEWYEVHHQKPANVTYLGGALPQFIGASYFDFDADGINNPDDPVPESPSNFSGLNSNNWGASALLDDDYDQIANWWDPVANNAFNPSSTNGSDWYGIAAISDNDGDGTLNWWDATPNPIVPPPDSDGDGLLDSEDPVQYGDQNYSPNNGQAWPGTSANADNDSDGTLNWWDVTPNAAEPPPDSDGDGLLDSVDPVLYGDQNYSQFNGLNWPGTSALGNADGDDVLNWWDATPNPIVPPPDSDGDGLLDSEDPAPADYQNYSPNNGQSWLGTNANADNDGDGISNWWDPVAINAFNPSSNNGSDWYGIAAISDNDSDGTSNWWDATPNPIVPPPDSDGDGLLDSVDPAPSDSQNYSSNNGQAWPGTSANADNDSDGTSNWWDATPSGPTTFSPWNNTNWTGVTAAEDDDGDTILNWWDPVPGYTENYSGYNSMNWPNSRATEDDDADTVKNWWDSTPYIIIPPPDFDGDGLIDTEDPVASDANNPDGADGSAWPGTSARGDIDGDGILNWWDAQPRGIDTDGDGISDFLDPVDDDVNNPSAINGLDWPGTNAMNDNDGDGVLNWWDATPNPIAPPPPDRDFDGIINSLDPVPDNYSNYSSVNHRNWPGLSAIGDLDQDSVNNWNDPFPTLAEENSDGDAYNDLVDPVKLDTSNHSGVNNRDWFNQALADADADGVVNFNDPTPFPDVDGDGLDSDAEAGYGTRDDAIDTDDDGLTDMEELQIYQTDPTEKFSKSLLDGWGRLYTDWQMVDVSDTDGDGIPSRIELNYGLDPAVAADAQGDMDSNGVSNLMQYTAGQALDYDQSRYDQDQDGMLDTFEDFYGFDKHNPADAVADLDHDGVFNYEEQILTTNPNQASTRAVAFGLPAGMSCDLYSRLKHEESEAGRLTPNTDANGNTIPDWLEQIVAGQPLRVAPLAGTVADWDGDGLPNLWEHIYGKWKYPVNGLQIRVPDASADNDGDGHTNLIELGLGSHPLINDSDTTISDLTQDNDRDGLTNGEEIGLGFSAVDRYSGGNWFGGVFSRSGIDNGATHSISERGIFLFTPLR